MTDPKRPTRLALRNAVLLDGERAQGLFLVTDAVKPTGTSMAAFQLGGRMVFVKEGRCVSVDDTLGGAPFTMTHTNNNPS